MVQIALSSAFVTARRLAGVAVLVVASVVAATPSAVSAQSLPDFTELVERVGPAVVNIRTMERANARSPILCQGEMDPRM